MVDFDNLPQKEKMRANIDMYDLYDRRFVDFKGLKGMLRKGLGKPWAKIRSDIVHYVKKNFSSKLWHEMIERIEWYVELNPMQVGDDEYVHADGRVFSHSEKYPQFLVHPKTGTLMLPKDEWTKIRFIHNSYGRRDYDEDTVLWFNKRYFRKIHGIWYEGEIKRVPANDSKVLGYVSRENDWLYKKNLFDAVLRVRIYSALLGDLIHIHGYVTDQGEYVSHKDFIEKRDKHYKTHPYNYFSFCKGHCIYCPRLWQISDATKRMVGIQDG